MTIRSALLPLLAACAVTLVPPAADAQTLPPVVGRAIAQQSENCMKPDKVSLEKGFMTRRDVNADGIPDYVLNYGSFKCGDTFMLYCGSAGCLTQVFASADGSFVKVLDENAQKVDFKTVKGRPAMLLGLHGTACGKRGVDACGATLYWNGSKFSPAN